MLTSKIGTEIHIDSMRTNYFAFMRKKACKKFAYMRKKAYLCNVLRKGVTPQMLN